MHRIFAFPYDDPIRSIKVLFAFHFNSRKISISGQMKRNVCVRTHKLFGAAMLDASDIRSEPLKPVLVNANAYMIYVISAI